MRESRVFHAHYLSLQGGAHEGAPQEMHLVGTVYHVFVKVTSSGIGIAKFKKWAVVFLIPRLEFHAPSTIHNEANIQPLDAWFSRCGNTVNFKTLQHFEHCFSTKKRSSRTLNAFKVAVIRYKCPISFYNNLSTQMCIGNNQQAGCGRRPTKNLTKDSFQGLQPNSKQLGG